MNLLIFQNPYEFFQFFQVYEISFFEKKNRGYNRATVISIARKFFVRHMESSYKKKF